MIIISPMKVRAQLAMHEWLIYAASRHTPEDLGVSSVFRFLLPGDGRSFEVTGQPNAFRDTMRSIRKLDAD